MIPFMKLVFVATDFSSTADVAVRQAADWARTTGAKLVVCHVVPNTARSYMLFPQQHDQHVLELIRQKGIPAEVARRVESLTGLDRSAFSLVVDEGQPDVAIVKRAEALGADLVVIGGTGSSALSRLLLGSTAERVVRYSHCPVLVARAHRETKRIVAATDFSDPAMPALTAATEIARSRAATLTAMHVLATGLPMMAEMSGVLGFAPLGPTVVPPDVLAAIHGAATAQLRTLLTELKSEGSALVVEGDAATAIVDEAEQQSADLVVIGTLGRTGLHRLALGSVAERVVRSASCSVLAVRLAVPHAA